MSEPLTYTVEQAGRLLGVSRGSAYQAARAGEIPTLRIGRRLLVPRHALEQLLGAHALPVSNGGKGGEQIEDT